MAANLSIVDDATIVSDDGGHGQGSPLVTKVRLDETFFEQLSRHAVFLDEAALRDLRSSPMALDIYRWLACRLPSLCADKSIDWNTLTGHFGAGAGRKNLFKPAFTENLLLALAAYREARVEVTASGVVLKPSPPPGQGP